MVEPDRGISRTSRPAQCRDGDVSLFAHAVKYARGFHGPFREAVNSQLKGDRRTYRQDPAANVSEALREVRLDLDVLRAVADVADVPVASYQASGEYAMVEFAAQAGAVDRERVASESLPSLRRGGASIVLS